jgi:hypothetical protein
MPEYVIEMLVVDRCIDEVLQRQKLVKVAYEAYGTSLGATSGIANLFAGWQCRAIEQHRQVTSG